MGRQIKQCEKPQICDIWVGNEYTSVQEGKCERWSSLGNCITWSARPAAAKKQSQFSKSRLGLSRGGEKHYGGWLFHTFAWIWILQNFWDKPAGSIWSGSKLRISLYPVWHHLMLQLEIKPLKFTIRNKTHFRRVFFKNCLYWMRRGWAKNAGKCRTAVSIQGGGYLHSGSPPEAHWREAHCDTQPLPAWCKPKPKPWTLAHSLFNAVLSTYLNLSQIQRLSNSHWTSENILFQKSDRLDPMKRLICPL